VDKIKLKLASWKASLITYAGRVQLVKSVLQSMMVYSITIYSWPISLIKELEKYMRNFIWSRDLQSIKMIIVSWSSVCKSMDKGGLGLRSISVINQSANLKLLWESTNSENHWAILLRSRVVRQGDLESCHSSILILYGLEALP
jgi:hypothetical protein